MHEWVLTITLVSVAQFDEQRTDNRVEDER